MSLIIITAAILFIYLLIQRSRASHLPLPPGPKPLSFLANVLDLTTHQLWIVAAKWAEEFGSVCYLHLLGQGIVFLNTSEAAFELLEKRGSIYSDRPNLVMLGDLCGCDNIMPLTGYGDKLRRQRKLMQRVFGAQVIAKHHPLLEIEMRGFLQRIISTPSRRANHIARFAGAFTLLVVYGYEVKSNDDDMLLLAEECTSILTNNILAGGGVWAVDLLPFLRYIPTWFPGAGFKRNAEKWSARIGELATRPYEDMKERLKLGTAIPSSCSTLLEDSTMSAQEEFDIKWAANSMYIASADTTSTIMSHFILAMVQHPEILAKAQKEIDAVVGCNRLPLFSDRPSLPFIEAIMNETLRMSSPIALGLPHRLTEDDVYNGMFIPKGTFVFGNIWAMLRDETLFPDAYSFNPERYMNMDDETAKLKDPRNVVYGFGRRRCPGANLIESSVWLLIACMTATLNLLKAIDECGNVIEPEIRFDNPILNVPSDFKCTIRPRSKQTEETIRQVPDVSQL